MNKTVFTELTVCAEQGSVGWEWSNGIRRERVTGRPGLECVCTCVGTVCVLVMYVGSAKC